MIIQPARQLNGTVTLPGDKSISHRYAILGGMATGKTTISGYARSADCLSTLGCLKQLGVQVDIEEGLIRIQSKGWANLSQSSKPLNAGNSGTTMRLLSGVLAAQPFATTIHGDDSLNGRPMQRITTPLTTMGAKIRAREGGLPPLVIQGTELKGIEYTPPVASAQVKSCVLLAGLTAGGVTRVTELAQTRDHTERALPVFGVPVRTDGLRITVSGGEELSPASIAVPKDFSAASFFILAALMVPGSEIRMPGVGINPTRTGILALLENSGIHVEKQNSRSSAGEPVCDLSVRYQPETAASFPAAIGGKWIPNLIDEIPVLAILGTQLEEGLRVSDAGELRKKESDRIRSTVDNLNRIGIEVEEYQDGFFIPPGQTIRGGKVHTYGDHRVAMAFSIAGLISSEEIELDEPSCVDISFPDFFEQLERVRK